MRQKRPTVEAKETVCFMKDKETWDRGCPVIKQTTASHVLPAIHSSSTAVITSPTSNLLMKTEKEGKTEHNKVKTDDSSSTRRHHVPTRPPHVPHFQSTHIPHAHTHSLYKYYTQNTHTHTTHTRTLHSHHHTHVTSSHICHIITHMSHTHTTHTRTLHSHAGPRGRRAWGDCVYLRSHVAYCVCVTCDLCVMMRRICAPMWHTVCVF
jgi:hypothetical protein